MRKYQLYINLLCDQYLNMDQLFGHHIYIVIKDIEALEKVQRKCIHMTDNYSFNFESIKARRWRQDMCETYKLTY